jgi:ABC-type nitrate/sulfonate/bicarbonate transport system ATPase subunit
MFLLDKPFGMLNSLTRMEFQKVQPDILSEDRMTALMVTHDVEGALFLVDRVVMMTSGPRARDGQILEVPFGRPRDRAEVLEHPDYYSLRGELISLLENEDRARPVEDAA